MIDIWWLLPAGMIGALIGALAVGLFAIASEEDDREERRRRRRHDQGGGTDSEI